MMSDELLKVDNLDALPLPVVSTDRVVVGRSNDLFRMDVLRWRGGQSARQSSQPPVAADFGTWLSQNSSTVTDLDDGFNIFNGNRAGGDNLSARLRSIPATSWDLRLGISRGYKPQRFMIAGLMLRESGTAKAVTWGFAHRTGGGMFINRWDGNSFNTTRFSAPQERKMHSWFRVVKNGSNIEFYTSDDPTVYGDKVFQQSLTTDFTTAPNQWGPFINPNNNDSPAVDMSIDVFDWYEA
jgi:hypothetical protein